jgi:hypothetical protein
MEPDAQVWQIDAAEPLYEPALQLAHVLNVLRPEPDEYLPALQLEQIVWPSAVWYWPVLHGVHTVELDLNLPAGQATHPPVDGSTI